MSTLNKILGIVLVLVSASTPLLAQVPGQPANSYVSGSTWGCVSGFQKSGNECVSIFANTGGAQPANSYVSGSTWGCVSGFQKSGNECVSIFAATKNNSLANTTPPSITPAPAQPHNPTPPLCAENGSCYGDISPLTGRPKTTAVQGYYRKDGTYVRGHYRSKK
jgi:hypothetical protein